MVGKEGEQSRYHDHYISTRALTASDICSLGALFYLTLILAIEWKWPTQVVFSKHSSYREPFFGVWIVATTMLVFAVMVLLSVRCIGLSHASGRRRKNSVLALPPRLRYAATVAHSWVSCSLGTAACACGLLSMGMFELYRGAGSIRSWALPMSAGVIPALFNVVLAGFAAHAAIIATGSIEGKKKPRRGRGRRRGHGSKSVLPTDAPPFPYDCKDWQSEWSMPTEPPRTARLHQHCQREVDAKLELMRSMGFEDENRNHEALYRADFVVDVALSRLYLADNTLPSAM